MKKPSSGETAAESSFSTSLPHPEVSQGLLLPMVVLFVLTLGSQSVSLAFGRSDPEQSFSSIVLPSLLFLTLVSLPMIGVGLALGRQMGLGAPLIAGLLWRQPGSVHKLRRDAVLATALGLALGGVLLLLRMVLRSHLPIELPALGHRGVLGGLSVSLGAAVAEEVWFRLGLMTLLVWCFARVLGHREVRPGVAWTTIAMTSIGFGLAHLPQLTSYGAASPFTVGATMFGNGVVGVLYGWCYWRRSLVAAMVAHFSVDLVLHLVPALVSY